MSNEILWFLFAIVNFGLITIAYKFFGKTGLFAWIAFGTILANIQVVMQIEFALGNLVIAATLGNIMYGTLFLVTDSLGEKYGHNDAKKAVYIGFFSLIATVIIMQFVLLFNAAGYDEAKPALEVIFGIMPQIAGASLLAYIVSQMLDVYLFQAIRTKFGTSKTLWIRNNGSTLISQFIDTLIFVPLAFMGWQSFEVIRGIFITTYVIKVMVAFLDTPFVYWIKKIKPMNE
jgi:uncharacterized integral membrane protein (TIGR00697 family)